jgi:hypothetical protein
MHELPYRTNSTWLSDDHLILLDAIFDHGAWEADLTQAAIGSLCNLPYSHNFSDDQLQQQLAELSGQHVITRHMNEHGPTVRITANGGDLWCRERTPIWDRFCTERYKTTLRGQTLMSVIAVSAEVRDTFLEIWPMYPARRRRTVIRDFGLIKWHPFTQLHVGLATYDEPNSWSGDEYISHRKASSEHQALLRRERTWWRNVKELQRFMPRTT